MPGHQLQKTVGAGVLCCRSRQPLPPERADVLIRCTAVIDVSASEARHCRLVNAAFTGDQCDFA